MQVREIMATEVVTIRPDQPALRAYQLMRDRRFRHLPVMTDERLVGIVSERDLRPVLLSPGLAEATVGEIMTDSPITIAPEAPVEEAARLLVTHKIGCLPVVAGDALVGIVTETDLLAVFVEFLGLLRASTRIDVVVPEAAAFEEVSRIIRDHQGQIISVAALTPPPGSPGRVYTFRLEPCDPHPVVTALTAAGYPVLSHEAGQR